MPHNAITPSNDFKNITFKNPHYGNAIDVPARAIAYIESADDGKKATLVLFQGYFPVRSGNRISYSFFQERRRQAPLTLKVEDINPRHYTHQNGLAERIVLLLDDRGIRSKMFDPASAEITFHASHLERANLDQWRTNRGRFYLPTPT